MGLIFRNDDVNPNTDLDELINMYRLMQDKHPDCEILSGVTILAKESCQQSVYPNPPFKHKPMDWFYNISTAVDMYGIIQLSNFGPIASHGLIHFDHSKANIECQKMSIVSSCRMLHTKKFIPPFNRFNDDTMDICTEYGIELVCGPEWKSMDYQKFTEDHDKWYFHSWRYTNESMEEKLVNDNVGR